MIWNFEDRYDRVEKIIEKNGLKLMLLECIIAMSHTKIKEDKYFVSSGFLISIDSKRNENNKIKVGIDKMLLTWIRFSKGYYTSVCDVGFTSHAL